MSDFALPYTFSPTFFPRPNLKAGQFFSQPLLPIPPNTTCKQGLQRDTQQTREACAIYRVSVLVHHASGAAAATESASDVLPGSIKLVLTDFLLLDLWHKKAFISAARLALLQQPPHPVLTPLY